MTVQQVGNIGIAIEIVVAGRGNTTQKIGVFVSINPIPVFAAEISHKPPVGTGAAVFEHRITVSQDTHLVKFLDDGIKLGGKFIGSVLLDLILIVGIKGSAAVSEIAAHKGNAAALRHKLIALRISVVPFFREHFTDIQIHFVCPSLSVIRNCPNSVKAYQFVRSKQLSLKRPFVRTRALISRFKA